MTLLTGADADRWMRMRPPGEDFFVSVPKALSRQAHEAKARGGPQRAVLYTSAHGFETFMVMRTDYAEEFVRRVDVAQLLDAAQARLLGDFGASLLEQKPRPFEGRPGREIRFEYREARSLAVAQVMLWGSRLYTVVGITSRPDRSPENIRRFLDSFAIHER